MDTIDTAFWIDKIQDHFINVFTFDLGRYLIAATTLAAILYVFSGWAEARRIQSRQVTMADYFREIGSSFRTVFFFALTGLTTVLMVEGGIVTVHEGPYSIGAFLIQVAVIVVAHDAYFYWMHRALHHKKLFRATHLHHHKSRTPTVWTAYSFSMWEAVTESAFMPIFLLAASLMGFDYIGFAVFTFLAIMIIRNVMGHCGVEIHPAGWVDTPWLDWITTTTHHDLHHSEGRHNFGFYFTWWDRWMGTEHPRYKEEFRKKAQPVRITTKFAERISVVAMAILAATATLNGWLIAVETGIA